MTMSRSWVAMILVWENWSRRLMRVRREAGSRFALGSLNHQDVRGHGEDSGDGDGAFSPPERWWVILSARVSAWTSRRACRARRLTSSGGRPMLSGPKAVLPDSRHEKLVVRLLEYHSHAFPDAGDGFR